MLATLVKRDAEEIALQKAAMADAYEGVRLAAMTNYAGRVLQAAVGPTIVSNVVYSLEATEAPIEQPVEPAAPLPSDKLIEMATVRRGEGPWQSAERILAADGKQHGVDEVRALTRAFQAVYKAEHDGNGDMSGLKVKYNFVTRDNFDDLIAACNNAEVKAILLNMAQGMPVA